MSELTYAALCAGYNGLGMGVQSVLGGRTCWVSEFDAHPSRILDFHWPDVPNIGDMTAVDWRDVEPVDVLEGGTPCQDLSHAGKQAGMTEGTRSNLWVQMREAIHVIRPKLVVWENVRGAFSACADSAMGRCPRCVGDDPSGRHAPWLRALGRVLGDLSSLGYDAWWYGLQASDVGACHPRFRVFVFATPADSDVSGLQERWDQGGVRATPLGAPAATHGDRGAPVGTESVTLLPTPAVNDMGRAYTPETWDAWTERQKAKHKNGNGHGKSLEIEAMRLLPTPTVSEGTGPGVHGTGGDNLRTVVDALLPTPTSSDAKASGSRGYGGNEFSTLTDATVRNPQDWSIYETAIRRHEAATGRPAPAPTEPGPKGGARLSPAFVEWMMMLPAGHVTNPAIWEGMTDKRGRTIAGDRLASAARNAQLKALGNGVVPNQAAAACRMFLRDRALLAGAA